jgi:oligosaccharide repeat unit polymerase
MKVQDVSSRVPPRALFMIMAAFIGGLTVLNEELAVLLLFLSGIFVLWYFLAKLFILKDFFSPILLFTGFWFLSAILSSLQLTTHQRPWPSSLWLHVLLGGSAFVFGGVIAYAPSANVRLTKWRQIRTNVRERWAYRRVVLITAVITSVSVVFLAYEYWGVGSIPLLSPNVEFVRFEAIRGGYVDALALSSRLSIMILAAYYFALPRFSWKRHGLGLIAMIISFALLLTTARRGAVVFPALIILICYYYLRGISFRTVSLGLVALVIFVALFAHFRFYRTFGESYIDSLNAWQPDFLPWLAPGYLTIAYNYEVYRDLTETIPSSAPFQYGKFTLYPWYGFWPGHQENMGEFQNRIWNIDAGLSGGALRNSVPTYLGTLYVDFGVIGVILGSIAMGIMSVMAYIHMRRRPSSFSVLIYGYVVYMLILSLFVNPLGYILNYWDILILVVADRLMVKR